MLGQIDKDEESEKEQDLLVGLVCAGVCLRFSLDILVCLIFLDV